MAQQLGKQQGSSKMKLDCHMIKQFQFFGYITKRIEAETYTDICMSLQHYSLWPQGGNSPRDEYGKYR
jgi:hypothetical protein